MVNSEVLNFKETLQPGTGDDFSKTVQKDGVITRVTEHFPPGTNALVDVIVKHNSTQIVPRDGPISIDDFTISIDTEVPVKKGDVVTVSIDNADDTNAHTISVTVQILPRKGGGK